MKRVRLGNVRLREEGLGRKRDRKEGSVAHRSGTGEETALRYELGAGRHRRRRKSRFDSMQCEHSLLVAMHFHLPREPREAAPAIRSTCPPALFSSFTFTQPPSSTPPSPAATTTSPALIFLLIRDAARRDTLAVDFAVAAHYDL